MTRKVSVVYLLLIFGTLCNCRDRYKAGNLISLDYPIETRLNSKMIESYIDKMVSEGQYEVPDKWKRFHKLDDLNSTQNKRIYFKSDPEEMYVLSFGGSLILTDVYNPKINGGGAWVADRKLVTSEEENRIRTRVMSFLAIIEKRAKDEGIPDSVIYFNPIDQLPK